MRAAETAARPQGRIRAARRARRTAQHSARAVCGAACLSAGAAAAPFASGFITSLTRAVPSLGLSFFVVRSGSQRLQRRGYGFTALGVCFRGLRALGL
jgi:hypothetical protein